MKRLFILAIFFSNCLYASVTFDPYLGVPLGKTTTLEDNIKADLSGFGIGGRTYYEYMGFFAGGDLKFTAHSSDIPDRSYEQNQLGLLGGIDFPFAPIRAWLALYFLDVMNVSPDEKEYKGGGYALGIGVSPLPFFSINMEYKNSTYDEVETPTGDVNLSPEVTISGLFVSLSFLFKSEVF